MNRLTVIDLDSIVYIIAYRYMDKENCLTNAISVRQETHEYIEDILSKTEAECYAGFYQKENHRNFRKDFYPEYKANRPPTPDFIKIWRSVIHEAFLDYNGITGLEVIESDDALSLFYYRYNSEYSMTFTHRDKDLKCIPGKHYKFGQIMPGEQRFTSVTIDEGDLFFKSQVLSGDSSDNIPGIFKVGPKGGVKFVNNNDGSVFKAFRQAYKKRAIDLTGKNEPKRDSWIVNCHLNYHLIRLLHNLEELKKFTDRKEVDIFNIDCFEYGQKDYTELSDW